jgi:hypothetical protein
MESQKVEMSEFAVAGIENDAFEAVRRGPGIGQELSTINLVGNVKRSPIFARASTSKVKTKRRS